MLLKIYHLPCASSVACRGDMRACHMRLDPLMDPFLAVPYRVQVVIGDHTSWGHVWKWSYVRQLTRAGNCRALTWNFSPTGLKQSTTWRLRLTCIGCPRQLHEKFLFQDSANWDRPIKSCWVSHPTSQASWKGSSPPLCALHFDLAMLGHRGCLAMMLAHLVNEEIPAIV